MTNFAPAPGCTHISSGPEQARILYFASHVRVKPISQVLPLPMALVKVPGTLLPATLQEDAGFTILMLMSHGFFGVLPREAIVD